jgi:O6-methylguanine-DNA--protein-cysteine methyltransferase
MIMTFSSQIYIYIYIYIYDHDIYTALRMQTKLTSSVQRVYKLMADSVPKGNTKSYTQLTDQITT